jgi:uncharacterized membrane protein
MRADAQLLMLWLCTLGLMAWIALMVGFGLIAVLRKFVAWVSTWT